MSKNFELMQQTGRGPVMTSSPSQIPQKPLSVSHANGNGHRNGNGVGLNLDDLAQEETLKLVQRVFLLQAGEVPRTVIFAGIDHGNGCSRVCARTAQVLAANTPGRVCIVDANLRSPSPKPLLEEPDPEYDNTRKGHRRIAENLWLATCDSLTANGGASTLDQMRVMIKDLRHEFEHVVINAPPVGLYSDAALLGQSADGLVLVLEANSTRRVAARKAKLALEASNVLVLGTVLNNRTFPIPEKIYRLL